MIEIAYLKENSMIKEMPHEVKETIQGILQILDTEYGEDRHRYEDGGGYVLVVEKEENFQEIESKCYIDCDTVIAEYVDKILCSNGEVYTNSLVLCNNDYAISLIIPMKLTPQNLINYIIE